MSINDPQGLLAPGSGVRPPTRQFDGPGFPLVQDAARPTMAELQAVRQRALAIVAATRGADWGAVWQLRVQDATSSAYLAMTMAELLGELAEYADVPLGSWVAIAREHPTRSGIRP